MTENEEVRNDLASELEIMNERFYDLHCDAWEISRRKNVAENGRLINELLFVLMLVLGVLASREYFYAALFPVASIGIAWLADALDKNWLVWPAVITTVSPILALLWFGL